jgi:glycosyltransferase involved in cell wall biosynthesis
MSSPVGGARIALLAPVSHPVPPPGYGPWEQVAYNTAEGLRQRGVDVTLFAAADSTFAGKRRAVLPASLTDDAALNAEIFSSLHIANLFAHAGEFDLIHSHLDWRPLCHALGSTAPPMLTTIHGFSSPLILAVYYAAARRSFYCSISDADRDPGLPYVSTVHNGIDLTDFRFRETPDDYLLFFGRIHEEKGVHLAVEIAARAHRRLVIAGIVHDECYFRERIAPHIDGDRVRFVGEMRGPDRDRLLGGALALIHMNTRPERFGLAMVEAMACGTPVVGSSLGSVPEIVLDGITGFVCGDVDEAVDAVLRRLREISRSACRAHVERRFTVDAMIDGYIKAYTFALEHRLPDETLEQRAARRRDWWDRPMAYTDIPAKPPSLVGDLETVLAPFDA